METLYEKASLILNPGVYDTSKVYATKPFDGSGDLTFTRSNDTATRVASNGLIEKVRTNLILQSNSFNTTWYLSGAVLTSGQAGYDGTTNAWLLDKNATQGRVIQSISQSGIQTLSVYAKKGTSEFLRMFVNGPNSSIYFNLNDGSVQSSASIVSGKSTDVGGGWYRCEVAFDGTTTFVNIYPAESGSTAGTSGTIYIQDAQLEKGDIATDYIATTTAAVSVGPVANVPRLDFLGSSCPRLLLEPQRQNLALFSESFDNAAWNKVQSSATANQMTSPSGYQDADLLIENTVNSSHSTNNNAGITSTAGIHTASAFFKKNTKNFGFIQIATDGAANRYTAVIDLVNGTITNTATLGSPTSTSNSIVDYGNGWYRVSVSAQHTSSTLFIVCGLSNSATPTYSATAYPTYIGNGTDSIGLWGAQLELGSYASSYVNTLGAAVTRGAESASKTGIASLIGQSEGTLFVEVNANTTGATQDIELGDGTVNNRVILRLNPDNTFRLICVQASSFVLNKTSVATFAQGENLKIAAVYKSSAISQMFVNGVSVLSATAGIITGSFSGIFIGSIGGSINLINSPVEQMILFPTALSDADAIALTA